MDILKNKILCMVNLYVAAIVACERFTSRARCCTPIVSVSKNLDVYKCQVLRLETIDSHAIGSMVYEHVFDGHIVCNDFEGIIL